VPPVPGQVRFHILEFVFTLPVPVRGTSPFDVRNTQKAPETCAVPQAEGDHCSAAGSRASWWARPAAAALQACAALAEHLEPATLLSAATRVRTIDITLLSAAIGWHALSLVCLSTGMHVLAHAHRSASSIYLQGTQLGTNKQSHCRPSNRLLLGAAVAAA